MINLLLSSLIAASPPKMLPEKLDLSSNVSQSKLLANNDISGQYLSLAGTPTAPSNLTMAGVSKGASTGSYFVDLKWKDNSSNETGFTILQSRNATSGFVGIKNPGANVTNYNINMGTNPASGTYYFKVKSASASGESAGSNVVSANITSTGSGGTTPPPTPPTTTPPTTTPPTSTGSTFTPPAGFSKVYSTTFDSVGSTGYSFDGWGVQANSGDVSAVSNPDGTGGKVIKITASKSENFASVANGTPRAEMLRSNNNFQQGKEYYIHFKLYLPSDYQFDQSGAQESIAQIHQDVSSGPPPFLLGLDGSNYYMYSEAGNKQYKQVLFGSASGDRGKWVDWTLHYKPSSSSSGVSQLYKNGTLVQTFNAPNAYPNGTTGYLKLGIYKWAWETNPSSVTSRTRYYDDVDIYQN